MSVIHTFFYDTLVTIIYSFHLIHNDVSFKLTISRITIIAHIVIEQKN